MADVPAVEAPRDVPPTDDAAFVTDRVIDVAIAMAPDDWEELRQQSRSIYGVLGPDCLDAPFESPFTWFDADVSLDGAPRPGARVRKKGFIGSLSTTRPSLRLELGDAAWEGVTELNLNGAPQDPTRLRTCLAYELYAAADVPAPRCGFARVSVNGEALGVYATVERVDEAFLERAFGEREGALFEGTLSDVRDGWTGTFDPDTEGASPEDLAPLAAAVAAPDATLEEALAAVLDLDAFHRFWAAEVLLGQWDGYAANANNYYIYVATDGRARFVAWGPDAAFSAAEPFGLGAPRWVVANAALPWRLAGTEAGLARHRAALEALLDAWDADAALDRIDALDALVAPYDDIARADLRALRSVVRGTEDAIRESLDADAPTLPDGLAEPPCLARVGTLTVPFSTTWGSFSTQDPAAYGSASLRLEWGGDVTEVPGGTCVTGVGDDGRGALLQVFELGEAVLVPYLSLPTPRVGPGVVAIDGFEGLGALYYSDASTRGAFVEAAYFGEGELRLDVAGRADGDRVSGELVTGLWTFP